MHVTRQKQDTRHRYAFEKKSMEGNTRANSRDKMWAYPLSRLAQTERTLLGTKS